MSDTPRVDAAILHGSVPWVQPDFARQLERELAAMTAERDALKKRNTGYEEVCEVNEESDPACVVLRAEVERLSGELAEVTAERDEAWSDLTEIEIREYRLKAEVERLRELLRECIAIHSGARRQDEIDFWMGRIRAALGEE